MATKHPSWPCGDCARVYGTAFANYAYRAHCLRRGKCLRSRNSYIMGKAWVGNQRLRGTPLRT
eukprot:5164918-Pyramimonas_sp.AAC.1